MGDEDESVGDVAGARRHAWHTAAMRTIRRMVGGRVRAAAAMVAVLPVLVAGAGAAPAGATTGEGAVASREAGRAARHARAVESLAPGEAVTTAGSVEAAAAGDAITFNDAVDAPDPRADIRQVGVGSASPGSLLFTMQVEQYTDPTTPALDGRLLGPVGS